jgi:hypothetical protein
VRRLSEQLTAMPRDWIAWIRAHAFAGSCVSLVCAACLVPVIDASAQPVRLPPAQAVAMLGRGVVWFDEGPAFLDGYGSPIAPLGTSRLVEDRAQESVAASASAVAALGDQGRFVGGLPPAPLRPIAQPKPVQDGECLGWLPATGGREKVDPDENDFAVVADELVDTGECLERPEVVGEEAAARRQPLFVRSLRGGRWRVLRWLPGVRPPILAADGDLLAIGEQRSLAKMEVSILDLSNGRAVAGFGLPDGYLSFASSERLVVSVPAEFWPEERNFPLGPQVEGRHSWEARLYRLELYSTRGRYIREVGTAGERGSLYGVLISQGHLISQEFTGGESVLSVRSLAGGAARPVIAFDSPARALLTLGFRWPALAVVQSTSTPLLASELTCSSGYYHAASKPSLLIFDLARAEPFAPPLPLAHFETAVLPKNCPPEAFAAK